jgi:molybdopterin-binding protein
MMSLELNDAIKAGTKVKLSIAPSHVAIAKNLSGDVSYSNRLPSTILSIENGKLLSSLKLGFFDTVLESIITVESSKRLDLKVTDRVTALIKASELSISKVIDD